MSNRNAASKSIRLSAGRMHAAPRRQPKSDRLLATSPQPSRLRAFVEKAFAASSPEDSYVDLDLSACEFGSDAYLILLQDIVRRAKGLLPYVTIAGSYTCSKMRNDGFGGMCIVITPRAIRYRSTYDILQRFTARFEKGQAANRAPPAPPPE